MHHVISAGRRILKLASNVEIFFYFLVYCTIEKKVESLCKFCNEILKVPQNAFQSIIRKTQQQQQFDIQHQFQHSLACPNDMIYTYVKWVRQFFIEKSDLSSKTKWSPTWNNPSYPGRCCATSIFFGISMAFGFLTLHSLCVFYNRGMYI